MQTEDRTASKGSRVAAFLQIYAVLTLLAGGIATAALLVDGPRTGTMWWTAFGILLGSTIWSAGVWGLGVLLEHVIVIRRKLYREPLGTLGRGG